MSARDIYRQAKGIGGFQGVGSPGRSSTATVSGLLSPGEYLEMMAQDANANSLDILLKASKGGLMGMLTKEHTRDNPYFKGKASSSEDVSDFNKEFMQNYGVRSGDLLGFEEALRQGDIKQVKGSLKKYLLFLI